MINDISVEIGRVKISNNDIIIEFGKSKHKEQNLQELDVNHVVLLDTKRSIDGKPIVKIYVNGQHAANGYPTVVNGRTGIVIAEAINLSADILNIVGKDNIIELDTKKSCDDREVYDVISDGRLTARGTLGASMKDVKEGDIESIKNGSFVEGDFVILITEIIPVADSFL